MLVTAKRLVGRLERAADNEDLAAEHRRMAAAEARLLETHIWCVESLAARKRLEQSWCADYARELASSRALIRKWVPVHAAWLDDLGST